MIKLLIGGSPCTYWSCAQKNNRETEPSGMGWELFKNYLIAKEKFKPDFFLYENNKSAAQAIKDEIKKQFGVWDGTLLMQDNGARYIEINSALVSAQNRQRFYVHNCGEVEQPADRGILLRDILESGIVEKDKAYCLKHQAGNARDYFKKHHTNIKFESVRVGTYPSEAKNKESKQYRIYDINGKSTTLCGEGGGLGAKTGLYAIPFNYGAEAIEFDEKGNPIKARSYEDGKIYIVYEVKDSQITIKGKQYPIKLKDGYYIIRKLTVTECCRLQGMPDWWFLDNEGNKIISDSQCYKGLGNGWQLDTVKYILEHGLKNVPKDEELLVLSLYDGIATGRRILEELGFKNIKYYAYEIDKYCIKLTLYRYPDIIHCGDAFQVREKLPF